MRIASASFAAALLASSCVFVVHDQGDDDQSRYFVSSSPTHRGSGTAAQEERVVGEFARVEAGGTIELDVRIGSPRPLEVRADDNLLAKVRTRVDDGTLRISLEPGSYETRTPIHVEITCSKLTALVLDGAARAKVAGLEGGSLDVHASGAAVIELAGHVDALIAELDGAAQLHAFELDSGRVQADVGGAAEADVAARDEFVADLDGAARLRYGGDPRTLRAKSSGASSIDRR